VNAATKPVAQGVRDAFLTVLTTGAGFGPNYPFSRDDLLAAVTEGVRQAFADVLGPVPEDEGAPVAGYDEPHPFMDDGKGLCEVTVISRSGNGGAICSEAKPHPIHRVQL
jgi:hypothetical protein